MTMTDPIADMLTRIRNGNVAMHDSVKMPSSKLAKKHFTSCDSYAIRRYVVCLVALLDLCYLIS